MKHGRVKIDPFFPNLVRYGKVTTRLKVIQTKPRQKYALKYKHDLSYIVKICIHYDVSESTFVLFHCPKKYALQKFVNRNAS